MGPSASESSLCSPEERAHSPVAARSRRTILVVSNHGEIVGGGEVSLLVLLKGLDRTRWSPVVVVPSEGGMATRCRELGLPTHVIPLPGLRRPWSAIFRSMAALKRLARDTGASLLHANGSRAMFYAGLVGRVLGRPAVWHLRVWREDPRLDWLLARLATRTIAISEAVRSRLRHWPAAHRRCSVVPNGMDLEAFAPSTSPDAVRAALGLSQGDRVIGTVGRLVAFKGHGYLLEAFARLRPEFPTLRLLIVGDGPERSALSRGAEGLGIAGAVIFTGHREDVADLLTVMEVFVLPSEAEDFGRVLLEAMALARPVVATAAGGAPEVVEEKVTGLLVRSADPAALAAGVAALLTDPARARLMGWAGRQRVEKHYTLRHHAELVETIYTEILRVAGA